MGKDWDAPWKTGAGMSKPGPGEREIPWPSHGGATPFGGANPTCDTCGGRLRGANKCDCEEPDWRVAGEVVVDGTKEGSLSEALKQRQAFQMWCRLWLDEIFRLLPTGGRIKVFGGTRMFHRMAQAMQNAGFIDIGLEAWVYGSGFPKSLNLSKAIDRHLGKSDERAQIGVRSTRSPYNEQWGNSNEAGPTQDEWRDKHRGVHEAPVTAGATAEAKRFEGWGTALKPAWEPFIVGTKPGRNADVSVSE